MSLLNQRCLGPFWMLRYLHGDGKCDTERLCAVGAGWPSATLMAVDTVWATEPALESTTPSMSVSAQLNCLRRGTKYHWRSSGMAEMTELADGQS